MRLHAVVILGLGCLVAALTIGTAGAQDDAAKKELKKLEGTWATVSIEAAGQKVTDAEKIKTRKLTTKGDKYTVEGWRRDGSRHDRDQSQQEAQNNRYETRQRHQQRENSSRDLRTGRRQPETLPCSSRQGPPHRICHCRGKRTATCRLQT